MKKKTKKAEPKITSQEIIFSIQDRKTETGLADFEEKIVANLIAYLIILVGLGIGYAITSFIIHIIGGL